ncbi:hypothetical protein [Alteromonas sp. a30]|uniref:hypothetical protein n=1 Tax=Alteromonas sp. a30 TaxID=2730917 RepID=UPI00227F3D8E|nr:hypothetical protein [Alteromonas sp. a30]MCY7295108.1 hypothetical protein [Alteromonas sp. a30]
MTQPTDGLVQVIDAMKSQLTTALNGVNVSFWESENASSVTAPAILIDIENLLLQTDLHDKVVVQVQWGLHCVLAEDTPDLQLSLRRFALSVMQELRDNSVWLPETGVTQAAEHIVSVPDMQILSTSGNALAWKVGFQQTLHLGTSYWDATAITPQNIYIARVKKGEPHAKSDHELVHPV